MALNAKTVQVTFAGTAPLTLTVGNIPFQPKEVEVTIGNPTNSTVAVLHFTTGRAVFNADNTINQNWLSMFDDGTKKQSSGTGKVANHYAKSGSSVVDSLVMSVAGFTELVPGTTWGVDFSIITLTTGTSLRVTVRG